jgi:hypothetical protein
MTQQQSRAVALPLMAGLIALPVIFVWVLLMPGYARSTRVAAFTYAFLPYLLVLLATALQFAVTGSSRG